MFKCRIVAGPPKEADASALRSIFVMVSVLDFWLGKSGVAVGVEVGVGGYQWQSLLFCCSLRCVPGPIRVDIIKINKKNPWGKNTHTDTQNQAMCSIECVPILNVEQFDLKSPAKKTTMKQQARPKKPTINFWGDCCCWHWLLKQTAMARIMKNIAASGVKIQKKTLFLDILIIIIDNWQQSWQKPLFKCQS